MSKNRYTKALNHLKNKALDEKLELLSEIPTNNTTGIYVDVPGRPAPEEIIPGPIDSPLDLDQDGDGEGGYEGKDTTGLFLTDGTIRAIEPPGDTSYILGPMISMWYAWANYTQIGYVRQEDRKMVNLGRITGELENWDEESGFTSYGQMSLDQAVWYKGQTRQDYRAFYPGPPSNPADEYGRYLGSIIATSKATTTVVPENPNLRYIDGTGKAADPTDNFALAMDRGGTALGIGFALWLIYQGGQVIKNIDKLIDDLSIPERERLFDNHTSQFGDTNAAAAAAEQNIGYEMASARGPYGTPGADKPYVRRGYKDKDGKFVDFDNPATWPSIVPKPPRASSTTNTMVAHYIAHGHFIKEQASGGGTITAHTEAGDVTINLPSSPPMPPEENTGMRTTPQGVDPLTDYSKNTLNWLKVQKSEYFVSGYIQGTETAELEKMFAGTTIKWYQVSSMVSEIAEIDKAKTEANERLSEHWDLISPQISSLLAQMSGLAATPADYYGKYLPLSNRVDALYAEYDRIFDECIRLSQESLSASQRLGRYVQSGKIVDMDPFKLNDPTIKKEKELDEREINDLINELKRAASDAKRSAALNKLKAFGYGALLAAGAVIGFQVLTGSAGVKALGSAVVNMLRKLAPKVKITPKPLPKDASALPQQLKAAAERAFDKLASKAPNDPTARGLLDRLSRAESSGNVSAVEKALKAFERYMGGTSNSPGGLFNSHEPSGKLLTENRKRILRNIKKPIEIKEAPTKFKVKPTGRKNKVVGSSMMKNVETPVTYKPITNIWTRKDKKQNIRASQEKKNQVLELVGAAEHHWTYLTEDRRRKKQDKINEMLSAEHDRAMEQMYEDYKKSPEGKAEKMINRIRSNIQPEYPKTAPPQMDPETGMHPKYGKKYKHDKLDPHSAESMPPTGDPVIDANVKKAYDPVKRARKLKNLIGKMKSSS